MIARPRLVLTSLLVALALAAAGVSVVVDVIVAHAQQGRTYIYPQRTIATQLRGNHWDDPAILAVAGAIALLGLLLLAIALAPGAPKSVRLASDDPDVALTATRRGVQRVVTASVVSVPGISKAKVRVRRRNILIRATSRLRDVSGLREKVQDTATRTLDALSPARPPRVKVAVRRRKD